METSWYEPIILMTLERSYKEISLYFPPGFIPTRTNEQS